MRMVGPEHVGGRRWRFTVWAPEVKVMMLHLVAPQTTRYSMTRHDDGYFSVECEGLTAGTRYCFQVEALHDVPDPASHYQPEGVHGHSEVVDHKTFVWHDQAWRGIPFHELIIYEIHTGTFSPAGTFDGIIQCLDDLVNLGINAIELMPVAQFPGDRNWGYDGVLPFAVQNSYGGPEGLKRLVDACHQKGMAVILDVVYNHVGPEGNYLHRFAPYFSKAHRVPWGDAVNFDQEWSDGVRAYFLQNVDHWVENYHVDGLRLDAIHCIFDSNPTHILEEFNSRVSELSQRAGRPLYLIAESDLNNARVVMSRDAGGYGFRAQWLDDFQHALYALVAPDGTSRYADFGQIEQLAKAFTDGFVHSGEFVKFRKRKFGGPSAWIDGDRFVAFMQNHDQVGNRVKGDRLSALVDQQMLRIAAAAVILSPYIPMLFMGEEYAESAPFMYFVSHSDETLIAAVREGRKRDFAAFGGPHEPPDAQAEDTFKQSILNWNDRYKGHHGEVLRWYKALIALRKNNPCFSHFRKDSVRSWVINPQALVIVRRSADECSQAALFFNFSAAPVTYVINGTGWVPLLDTGIQSTTPASQDATDTSVLLPPVSISVFGRSVGKLKP